jgi:hypothetical protein
VSVIDDYRKCSDDGKAEFLRDIEFEDIPEKWQLLRSVIADTNEYDLARVQALSILEIAGVPEEELPSFCELLVTIIETDEDYDVKNYAVMASKNFVNDSDVLKALIVETVLDAKEDIDIRHNAYAAVPAFFDIAGRKVVLEKLSVDAEMGPHARRNLAEFESNASR